MAVNFRGIANGGDYSRRNKEIASSHARTRSAFAHSAELGQPVSAKNAPRNDDRHHSGRRRFDDGDLKVFKTAELICLRKGYHLADECAHIKSGARFASGDI